MLARYGPNARVQVGNYIYWHINPKVSTGEPVTAFRTVLGTVMAGYGHMAFSEIAAGGQYLNPLRPGGVLRPYVDHAAPVIGAPSVSSGGQVVASAYDPQTFVRKTTYLTPVLAPAALAYRLYDSHGVPVTSLEWSFRGTQMLQFAQRSLIYAPGAQAPGYACFASRTVCIPHWIYRVADGLAPPLPTALAPGRYRLTIYAWDWADNTTALDTTLTLTSRGWKQIGHIPASLFSMPGYFERNLLLPSPPPTRHPLAPRLYPAPSHTLPLSPSYARPPTATGQQPPPRQQSPATGDQRSPPLSSPPASPTGGQALTGSPR